jgi:hypothetical protein
LNHSQKQGIFTVLFSISRHWSPSSVKSAFLVLSQFFLRFLERAKMEAIAYSAMEDGE